MSVGELWEKLHAVMRGTETLAQYMSMKKSQQDDLKDIGGFVGGTLNGPRRKMDAVISHDLVTLDFDNIPGWQTGTILTSLNNMNVAYCVYSTRKHTPNAPRLRVILPLSRSVTADEYEPCARRVADQIGISMADPTTFDNNRLMYWPSACSDSEVVYQYADAPFADADALLATYTNWRDIMEWPQVPGAFNYKKMAVKQGDPTEKPGIVGTFCRVYDVFKAMDELLPGIYSAVDGDPNRLTYLGGSTTGGAIVYDEGRFLFSHHATDPCSGRLVNAFDLVRLHKFADLDDNSDTDTPINRLPSFKAMSEFAVNLKSVAVLIMQERYQSVQNDFGPMVKAKPNSSSANVAQLEADDTATPDGEDADSAQSQNGGLDSWMFQLERNKEGNILPTINNIWIILEYDPQLAGKFALNAFAGRGEVLGESLPWSGGKEKRRLWSDTDVAGMYWYMEAKYSISKRANIDSALDIHAANHAFNDIQDYITGLKWDGVKRLDRLFIDYLGAADTEYTRTVTRKSFTAAVARAMNPGCKFDNMLILCGPQGIGKSTILDKMSKGFFNDSIRTFEGKEASELLQGVWIVEVAELDAFRQSDVSRIKQFLSLRADRYRAAYGRNVKELARCCVFFGTCNNYDVLRDTTGNRRFWPVDTRVQAPVKSVFTDLDREIDQLWAEAKVYWQLGEPLYLSGDMEKVAREIQESHRETNAVEGMIVEFIGRKVPSDWAKWPLDKRRIFWNGGVPDGSYTLVEREKVCAAEIWTELYNRPLPIDQRTSREINAVLRTIPGWDGPGKTERGYGVEYGPQRGFKRKAQA